MFRAKTSPKYGKKAFDSFNTKFSIFCFYKAFKGNVSEYILQTDMETIVEEFQTFDLTNNLDIVQIYATEYYQQADDYLLDYHGTKKTIHQVLNNLKIPGFKDYYLDTSLKGASADTIVKDKAGQQYVQKYVDLRNAYVNEFVEIIFSGDEFEKMLENRQCSYCGISLDQIYLLGQNGMLHNKRSETRGYTLEIDRKHPNLEYSTENCCMSCYWCNNAKTDEFFPHEFKDIAKGINAVWNTRLKTIQPGETVIFPEASSVWEALN